MTPWTPDELDRVATAGELRVAGLKRDGSLRTSTIIWQVRVGDDIYIRSVNGPDAAWFRAAQLRGEGQIQAGGVTKNVTFVRLNDHDAGINTPINAAYRAKYGTGSSVRAITSAIATSTTLKVVPRD